MKVFRVCGQFHGRTIVLHLVDSVKVVEVMGLTSGLRFSPPKKIIAISQRKCETTRRIRKIFRGAKIVQIGLSLSPNWIYIG